FRIERCLDCGLVYLCPQPPPLDLKKYYPSNYGPYQDRDNPLKYGVISQSIKDIFFYLRRLKQLLLHQNLRVLKIDTSVLYLLDLGCGNGNFLDKMRRLHPNWHLYGFDNNEAACERLRSKGFEVWDGNFMDVDLPKEYFDIIHLSHVIEHLEDPRKALIKIYNLLKSGGEITIITPNFNSLAARVFGSYWFALDSPRHLFLFSPETIFRLLSETHFLIKSINYSADVRVAIKSFNYLFDRKDMRINFMIWHLLWFIFKPIGNILSLLNKTSIMTIKAKKM
ncbi:MAG: class I SAM-dependent methyltransferase, partial [bacterium]|nr:class I SAM-dependent methyltransferase [bacterium]